MSKTIFEEQGIEHGLQVEPAFIDALIETAEETVTACLKSLGAPNHVVDLVENMITLGRYKEAIAEDQTHEWFRIDELTISTINLIVRSGGVFHTKSGITTMGSVFARAEKEVEA